MQAIPWSRRTTCCSRAAPSLLLPDSLQNFHRIIQLIPASDTSPPSKVAAHTDPHTTATLFRVCDLPVDTGTKVESRKFNRLPSISATAFPIMYGIESSPDILRAQ